MKKVFYVIYAVGFFYVIDSPKQKIEMAKSSNVENMVAYIKAAGMEVVFSEAAQFRMDFES